MLVDASTLGWQLLGIWIAGACLNYVPLALVVILIGFSSVSGCSPQQYTIHIENL